MFVAQGHPPTQHLAAGPTNPNSAFVCARESCANPTADGVRFSPSMRAATIILIRRANPRVLHVRNRMRRPIVCSINTHGTRHANKKNKKQTPIDFNPHSHLPLFEISTRLASAAPVSWPTMVTRVGSPPNAAMLSRVHCSAATMSSSPRLPPEPGASEARVFRKPANGSARARIRLKRELPVSVSV